jgi:hypothetical protein
MLNINVYFNFLVIYPIKEEYCQLTLSILTAYPHLLRITDIQVI